MFRRMLAIIAVLLMAILAAAGTWTPNNFLYKPSAGARGEAEKKNFDNGLDQIDQRLGKEIWVGDPGRGTTLQGAVTGIGGNLSMLRIPAGTWSINANFTIPANVTLKPERGAVLTVATGMTLTINGPLDARPYQIFSCAGTGKVVFGNGSTPEVHPEWWGAIGDGSVDCTAAIQAAFNSLPAGNIEGGDSGPHAGTLRFSPGRFKVTGPVYFYPGCNILGAGVEATVIRQTSKTSDTLAASLTTTAGGRRTTIQDLTIFGDKSGVTAGTAINLDNGSDHQSNLTSLKNLFITGGFNGINLGGMTAGSACENIKIEECAKDAFYNTADTNGVTFKNTYANHCGRHGYYVRLNYCSFLSASADNNGGDGYHLNDSSTSVSFISCGSEQNSGNGIFIGVCTQINISGFDIYFAGADSIKLSGTQFVNISGFDDSGQGAPLASMP